MYANEILNAYKQAQNYVQDKQIAHDLNLTPQKLSNIRKGIRYLTENEALFLAEKIGLSDEEVLTYLAADRSKNYRAQKAWENITKKYNGIGLSSISMVCGGFALWIMQTKEAIFDCALCRIKLNASSYIIISSVYNPFYNERLIYAPSKNDRELHFS